MSPTDAPDPGAEHRDLRESLGMHALGRLPEQDVVRLQAHLDGCRDCRDELDELVATAARLDAADPDALSDDATRPAPPPWLGDALMARVRAESSARPPAGDTDEDATGATGATVHALRGRRPGRVLTAVAAAVLAIGLVGGGVAVGLAAAPDGGPVENVALAEEAPGLDATAGVVPHTWGMEVRIVGSGFAPGGTYRATVLDAANRPVDAGTFRGTGGDELVCSLNSSVLRDQARGFTVTDSAGKPVLVARL